MQRQNQLASPSASGHQFTSWQRRSISALARAVLNQNPASASVFAPEIIDDAAHRT
jgi:hypothetical protein